MEAATARLPACTARSSRGGEARTGRRRKESPCAIGERKARERGGTSAAAGGGQKAEKARIGRKVDPELFTRLKELWRTRFGTLATNHSSLAGSGARRVRFGGNLASRLRFGTRSKPDVSTMASGAGSGRFPAGKPGESCGSHRFRTNSRRNRRIRTVSKLSCAPDVTQSGNHGVHVGTVGESMSERELRARLGFCGNLSAGGGSLEKLYLQKSTLAFAQGHH